MIIYVITLMHITVRNVQFIICFIYFMVNCNSLQLIIMNNDLCKYSVSIETCSIIRNFFIFYFSHTQVVISFFKEEINKKD